MLMKVLRNAAVVRCAGRWHVRGRIALLRFAWCVYLYAVWFCTDEVVTQSFSRASVHSLWDYPCTTSLALLFCSIPLALFRIALGLWLSRMCPVLS